MNETVLLSIDCSNRWSCLGLAAGGKPVAERCLDLGRSQAARLPLETEALLASQGLSLRDVTCIAAAVGPGYFTGIRIGMAYAAGLAFALKIDMIALSSLECVLRSFDGWDQGVKAPLIAASRELAFSSVWKDGRPVLAEQERTRTELDESIASLGGGALVAVRDPRLFAASTADGVLTAEKPSGCAAAALALEHLNERIKPNGLKARYLREPGLGRSL